MEAIGSTLLVAATSKPRLSTLNGHLIWRLKAKYPDDNHFVNTALLYEASQV